MRRIGLLIVLAGCPGQSPVMPDGGMEIDSGSQPNAGMSVTWKANPELPGKVSDKLTVSEARFQINFVEIVADSGVVMHSKHVLAWGPGGRPAKEEFHDAPPGVYSSVHISLGGGVGAFSYQISGTWSEDGTQPKPFMIEDTTMISVPVKCNTTLSVPGSAEIEIQIDLSDPLGKINFKDLEDEDGPIMISGNANMTSLQQFRDRLPHAFKGDDD
jgi:hypothetical protein